MDLLYAMLPKRDRALEVEHKTNCVSVKCLKRGVTGPRIKVGVNGGIQYHGTEDNVSDSYITFCELACKSLGTKKLRDFLSESHLCG